MRKIVYTLMVFAGVILSCQGFAAPVPQDKPDLSGTWKLNVEKSDFGQMPPPISETDVMTQTASDMKFAIKSERNQGERNYSITVKLDGTDTPTPAGTFPADSPFKIVSSKAEWDGKVLVITQQTTYQDNPGSLKSSYTLSADGKVLTKATQVSMGMGDFTTTVIYERQ